MTAPATPLTVDQILQRLRSMLPRANKRDRKALEAGMAAIFELATLLHVERAQNAGVRVVDPAGPVTPDLIDALLHTRRKARAAALAPPRRTRADEIADAPLDPLPDDRTLARQALGITLDPSPCLTTAGCAYTVGHGGPCVVVVQQSSEECGERCVMHDECDSPCILPKGHGDAHVCQFARQVTRV